MASYTETIITIGGNKFQVSRNNSGRFELRQIPKPAITQTLTYEAEQPVPLLDLDQYFFGSVTVTDDESKMVTERLSQGLKHD